MKPSQITDELKSAANGVASAAHQLNEDAVKVTKSAVKDAQKKLDDVKSEARGALKDMERNVKSHPGETLLLAFAAGVVFSLLLGRK
ncbi:MAG: hypothetical protein ACAH83_08750 [Alphaproteobacteria bacterium]